jgi:hypothetical protein
MDLSTPTPATATPAQFAPTEREVPAFTAEAELSFVFVADQVLAAASHRFGATVPPEVLRRHVAEAVSDLLATATVDEFVPQLALRRIRDAVEATGRA